MRPTILLCLLIMFTGITNAQFTLTPQAGFENQQTSVKVNNNAAFSPLGTRLSPQAGIRVDYKNKQGHGIFVGMATSRSITKFSFSDPEAAMNNYTASKGNTQFRMEGGYQFSTKPIYFKKSVSANKSSANHYKKNTSTKSCLYSMMRSSCGSKANKTSAARPANNNTWVRVQPSVGVAYIPFAPTSQIMSTSQGTQSGYKYNAGNWQTALITGVGLEFGRNTQSKFMLSVNYLKGMSNLGAKTVTTVSGSKTVTTSFKSDASAWNVRVGIPVTLSKKKTVVKEEPVIEKPYYKQENKCGQYKSMYRSKCGKVI
jgi:hypothetical protein